MAKFLNREHTLLSNVTNIMLGNRRPAVKAKAINQTLKLGNSKQNCLLLRAIAKRWATKRSETCTVKQTEQL